MIYVMSDIHGQKRRFDSIMKQIDLQPEDTLYVLGDVIDRNPYGIQILRQLMAMPNVKMLLGNHELMMLKALYYPTLVGGEVPKWYKQQATERWYHNGGRVTHNYLKQIQNDIRTEIFEFLDSLPVNCEIEVDGKKYILTHAAPACEYPTFDYKYDTEREFCVWMRYNSFHPIEGVTVVFGHTPTGVYNSKNPMQIWHGDGWIGVDCGCSYPEGGDPWSGFYGRLGCLRLDDMKEFYSEELEVNGEKH